MTTAEKIAAMQTKRTERPEVWQNDNGTWSHHMDSVREWHHRDGCEIDLRFTKEHHRGRI